MRADVTPAITLRFLHRVLRRLRSCAVQVQLQAKAAKARWLSFLDTRAHVQSCFRSVEVFERNTSMNILERFHLLPLSRSSHLLSMWGPSVERSFRSINRAVRLG